MSVDRLRQVAADATPGPWREDGPWWHTPDDPAHMVTAALDRVPVAINPPREVRAPVRSDMTFIATFDPPTVKALLDVAEAAELIESPGFADQPDPYATGIRREDAVALTDALARLREVAG